MPESKLLAFFSPLVGCFSCCFSLQKHKQVQGPEFGILADSERQYGRSGAEGDTLDLAIGPYCGGLARRYSTRTEMRNAVRVREVRLMREPRRRRFVDSAAAVPYDGAGGYRQEQDFDRDGVELDYWQKVPEREAEYLLVCAMDRWGAVGHVRLERQWMWERASRQGALKEDDRGGGGVGETDSDDEDEEDMSTWRPRRSVAVPSVIINRQAKLHRQSYGRRDLELGMVSFGGYNVEREREKGRDKPGDNGMYMHELALLALAVHRTQKRKTPRQAESRRRLREGNYARLLFDIVERRSHSMVMPGGEVWYEGCQRQEDIDRMQTISQYAADLRKFEKKVGACYSANTRITMFWVQVAARDLRERRRIREGI